MYVKVYSDVNKFKKTSLWLDIWPLLATYIISIHWFPWKSCFHYVLDSHIWIFALVQGYFNTRVLVFYVVAGIFTPITEATGGPPFFCFVAINTETLGTKFTIFRFFFFYICGCKYRRGNNVWGWINTRTLGSQLLVWLWM